MIAVRVQHALAGDAALGRELRLVHAAAGGGIGAAAAGVGAGGEFVDHHSLEDVGSVGGIVSSRVGLCDPLEEGKYGARWDFHGQSRASSDIQGHSG